MDEIEDALRQFADDHGKGWEVTTNSAVTRVEAQTVATYLSDGEAFAEAHGLVASLLELGYEQREFTEIGAIATVGGDQATLRWRGKISLIMRSRLHEGL